jgi:hypothetical protein
MRISQWDFAVQKKIILAGLMGLAEGVDPMRFFRMQVGQYLTSCCSRDEMVFGASSLIRYLAGSRSAVAGLFPSSSVIFSMAEYSKRRDGPHFIVDVRDQPGVILLNVEDNAITNQIGVHRHVRVDLDHVLNCKVNTP